MKLTKTEHNYYCSDSNYYVGNYNGEKHGRSEYKNWEEFKENWLDRDCYIDHNLNHCFRFDIHNKYDENEEEIENEYYMELFFILQRKGIFKPVLIRSITEKDMKEIECYLKLCWNYLEEQWKEFSKAGKRGDIDE